MFDFSSGFDTAPPQVKQKQEVESVPAGPSDFFSFDAFATAPVQQNNEAAPA